MQALDLDGDGTPDPLFFSISIGGVTGTAYYALTVDGGVAPSQSIPLASNVSGVDIAYSPDGREAELDAVGPGTSGRWIWNDAKAALVPAVGLSAIPVDQTSVLKGDFNFDNSVDLAVVDERNTLRLLLGSSGGQLEIERLFAYTGPFGGLAQVGDLDGDGHDDLVAEFATVQTFLGVSTHGGGRPALATGALLPLGRMQDFSIGQGTTWLLTGEDDGGMALEGFAWQGRSSSAELFSVGVSLPQATLGDALPGGTTFALFGLALDGTQVSGIVVDVTVGGSQSAVWTGPLGQAQTFVDSQGQGTRDLVVATFPSGTQTVLQVFPYQAGGATPWATTPASVDGGFFLDLGTSGGTTAALVGWGLTPGAPLDQLAGRYDEVSYDAAGDNLDVVWVAEVGPGGQVVERVCQLRDHRRRELRGLRKPELHRAHRP